MTADGLDFLNTCPSVTQGLQVPVPSICAAQEISISPLPCLCGLPLLWAPHSAPSQLIAGSSPSLCLGVAPWSGVCPWPSDLIQILGFLLCFISYLFKKIFIIYLLLTVLGLHGPARAFSSWGVRTTLVMVSGLLMAVVPLAAVYGL